ncbi:MAG: 30S ribosomal protein S6 [Tissierellales bacterium]
MRKYEALLILVPNLEEEARNQLLDRFKGIVEKDGTITNIDEWGTRKLAYEINNYKEGYYVVMNFETTQDVVKELDRVSRISDSVMRYMIIKEDE